MLKNSDYATKTSYNVIYDKYGPKIAQILESNFGKLYKLKIFHYCTLALSSLHELFFNIFITHKKNENMGSFAPSPLHVK